MASHKQQGTGWGAILADYRLPYLTLMLIPVGTIVLASYLRGFMVPFYLFDHDPDYAYLFNGISILSLVAPHHTDHPGTPVQILVALVLKAMYPLSGVREILSYVLPDPEKHLLIVSHALSVLVAGAVFVAGIAMFRITGSLVSALLTQMPPLVFGVLMQSLPRVNPEPMVLAVSMLCVAYLGKLVRGKDTSQNAVYARSLGMISGLGIAAKLTFMPVIFVPLALFSGWKMRRRFLLFVLLGFFVATLPLLLKFPLLKLYRRIGQWAFDLLLGSGIYGQGPRTVVDIGAFVLGFRDIASNQPLYVSIVVLTLVTLVVAFLRYRSDSSEEHQKSVRVLAGLAMMHIVMIVLVAKHHQNDRYLVATLGLSGFTLAVIYECIKAWWPARVVVQRAAVAAVTGVVVLLAAPAWAHLSVVKGRYDARRTWLAEVERTVHAKYSDCAQIHQESSTQEFALFFGLQWSRKSAAISEERDAFFQGKGLFTYDPGQNRYFSMSEADTPVEQIKRHAPCVVMRTPQIMRTPHGLKVL